MRPIVVLISILPMSMVGQVLIPDLLTELSPQLNETSGLLVLDEHVWTILDSGNPAAVYEVDPINGSVIRTVDLLGASNVDYEEITADVSWVYIGDFGNNSGARTNLRIYRIPRTALENEGTTEIAVDTIRFSFADQVDFTPAYNNNNFDCEAFVAVDDSLFLFTKRWIDESTQLYALPITPGDHVAQVRGILDTDGLITAASWDGTDRLVLLGHEDDPGQPFIWLFNSVDGHDFFGTTGIRREVDLLDHQTEGIGWLTPDEWILSNELASGFQPALWSIDVMQTVVDIAATEGAIGAYPVPTNGRIVITGMKGFFIIRILDASGRIVLTRDMDMNNEMDLGGLANGRYIAEVRTRTQLRHLSILVAR